MLRTYLGARSRLIVNGLLSHSGYYLHGPHLCMAGKVVSNEFPIHKTLGCGYSSNASDKPRTPNSFVQLVEHIQSFKLEELRKIVAKKNGTQPESKKKKKKKKKKTQGEKDESGKEQNSGGGSKPRNEHIVAALVQAIKEDYWPDIIYYSTLHPQHLQGWHPDESEWLAGHRMSIALSELPEGKLDSICDSNGVLAVEKLAKIWAKKRLDQIDYIPGIDYDKDLLAADTLGEMASFSWRKHERKRENAGSRDRRFSLSNYAEE
ncbi:hypothetical protein FRC11_002441, partial [Ceratobasidium sp. 423]